METICYFIMVPMVYIAFGVFIFGTFIRLIKIFREPKQLSTLQIFPEKRPNWLLVLNDTFLFPTVRRHKPLLWVFLMVFHICLVLLFIGHLELIADFRVLQLIPHNIFIGNGFVGLTVAVALMYFIFRRFRSPVRELSVPEDYFLLILLLLVVIFGSEMDWARNWYEYSEMTVEDYRAYLSGLILLNPVLPDAVAYSGHSFMLVIHIFFANLFLIFFPFTHLMHSFLSLSMNKIRRG